MRDASIIDSSKVLEGLSNRNAASLRQDHHEERSSQQPVGRIVQVGCRGERLIDNEGDRHLRDQRDAEEHEDHHGFRCPLSSLQDEKMRN